MVLFLRELHLHLPELVAGLDVALGAPDPVRHLQETLAQQAGGVVEHLAGDLLHEFDAVVAVQLLHPGPAHVVGGDLALEVQTHHDRLPRHVGDGVEHVPADLPALEELDAGDADALVADLGGARRVSAGGHGADVGHVHERGAPADQAVVHVDRRDHVHIRLMNGGQVGVVDQEHVAREDPALIGEALDDAAHRDSGAAHVPGHGVAGAQDVAVGLVKARQVVPHLGRVDGPSDPLQRSADLLGDLIEPVRENLEGDRIDRHLRFRHGTLLVHGRAGFGASGVEDTRRQTCTCILMLRYSSITAVSPGPTTMVVTGLSMIPGPWSSIPGASRSKS